MVDDHAAIRDELSNAEAELAEIERLLITNIGIGMRGGTGMASANTSIRVHRLTDQKEALTHHIAELRTRLEC